MLTPSRAHAKAGGSLGSRAEPFVPALGLVALLAALAGAAILAAGPALAARVAFWFSLAVLAYAYFGYALLLVFLNGLFRHHVNKDNCEPSVTLFITAHDEAAVIEAKLKNALALDYPPERLEIVVASDGSVDDTNAIVRSFFDRSVRLLEFAERRGKIATINAGVPATSGEILVFSDANAVLESGALRALLRALADPNVGAVSGKVVMTGERARLGRGEDLYYRYERWLQWSESILGSMVGADGALYAVRRPLFVPPPDDTILDDVEIPMAVTRAGYRVVFEPEARAYEQGSSTAGEEFARKARIVAGAVQFLERSASLVDIRNLQLLLSLVSHKVLRWMAPGFAAAAFGSSLILAGISPFYQVAAAVQATFYALGAAGTLPVLRRVRVVAIAHYFCLVHAAAAVGFFRGLCRRQPVTWERFVRAPVPSAECGVRLDRAGADFEASGAALREASLPRS